MPVDYQTFANTAFAAGAHARLRIDDQGQLVTRGTSLKGRAVEWFKEVFGDGHAENRQAIHEFYGALKLEYGAAAAQAAQRDLDTLNLDAKPLCKRHVERAIEQAKAARKPEVAEQNKALAKQLADLGDGTTARLKMDALRQQGVLSPQGYDKMLTTARLRLKAVINDAVLQAAQQDEYQPLAGAEANRVTEEAVERAAREMTAAENKALATELADLGGPGRDTVARDMIVALHELGVLSDEGANHMLNLDNKGRASLEQDIQQAVLEAAKQNENKPLDPRTAMNATADAVLGQAGLITNQEYGALAKQLADLGEDTHARARIDELVNGGLLSPAAAEALRTTDRAELEQRIEQAVKGTLQGQAKWNGSLRAEGPLTVGERSVRDILEAAPQDNRFSRAVNADEASKLAETAIDGYMERRAAVLNVIKDSDLPAEAKEQLSLFAMTDPNAKNEEYGKLLVNLTKDATVLIDSLQTAKSPEGFLEPLQSYTKQLWDRAGATMGSEALGADTLSNLIYATTKAGLAVLDGQPDQLRQILNGLVEGSGGAVIKGMAAVVMRPDLFGMPTEQAATTLNFAFQTGFYLAGQLARRLEVRQEEAAALQNVYDINSVDDLPGPVHDLALKLGMKLPPNLEHARSLASRMNDFIGSLRDAETPRDQLDAQIAAHDAFSRACEDAGLEQPEEKQALLDRALNEWVSLQDNDGAKTCVTTLTNMNNLRLAAGLGALTRTEKPVIPVAVEQSPFLQSIVGLDHFVKSMAVAAAERFGKSEEVSRRFDQAAAGVSHIADLHPAIAERAREERLIPPMPSLSEPKEGAFPSSGIQAFQKILNAEMSSADPSRYTNAQLYKDLERPVEFRLLEGDKPMDWPSLDPPEDSPDSQLTQDQVEDIADERSRQLMKFFDSGGDLGSMGALMQVTNQILGASLMTTLSRSSHGPFQASVVVSNQPEDPAPVFAISRTAEGRYRVEFEYRFKAKAVGDPASGEMTTLDKESSRLELQGAFEISPSSIRKGQPKAEVQSLTYAYKFHPQQGDQT
jgi:hypothetical protein